MTLRGHRSSNTNVVNPKSSTTRRETTNLLSSNSSLNCTPIKRPKKTSTPMTYELAQKLTGGLTTTTKMPCKSYSIPSSMCLIGGQLRKVKGSVCEHCYTYRYRRFPNVIEKQQERIATLIQPRWVEAMAYLIKSESNRFFRWHDSGDLQGIWHLKKIVEVARLTPEVNHWLPTLEVQIVEDYLKRGHEIPFNLCIRFSAPMVRNIIHVQHPLGSVKLRKMRCTGSAVLKMSKKQKEIVKLDYLDRSNICPAFKNDGKCGDCRKCWDNNEEMIHYVYH